jgi:hypothetical protein
MELDENISCAGKQFLIILQSLKSLLNLRPMPLKWLLPIIHLKKQARLGR